MQVKNSVLNPLVTASDEEAQIRNDCTCAALEGNRESRAKGAGRELAWPRSFVFDAADAYQTGSEIFFNYEIRHITCYMCVELDTTAASDSPK